MADTSSPPSNGHNRGFVFNGVFLAYSIVAGALTIFFLSYFNRVLASAISWLIRTWTWHQYRIYIDIQAIQLSLLGGRVFFTGFRYHGNNETILIQNGHITWAYWLRRVRAVHVDKINSCKGRIDAAEDKSRLPCRVNVQISGLEWFVYNRSPAYDSILEGLTKGDEDASTSQPREDADGEKNEDDDADSTEADMPRINSKRSAGSAKPDRGRLSGMSERSEIRTRSDNARARGSEGADSSDLPTMLQLFPVHLECNKAALVMGNENTKAVLIVKTDALSGEIDASSADTAPDPYRQIFKLNFAHPVIEMKDNQDYKEQQADKAAREKAVAKASAPLPKRSFFRHHRRLNHWQGLSRYLDEDAEGPGGRWASVEYAAVPTILDSPEASLTIYWDVVGKVPPRRASRQQGGNTVTDINGDEPPAWAINLSIKGGAINYGPWADRLRADLQRTFFPTLCKDAVPAKPLSAGADRIPTKFKLYLELDEEATLRVPIREASKNWRWTGKEHGQNQGRGQAKRGVRNLFKKSEPTAQTHQRPYGWLDVKVAANTTVSYSMDMVANASGYSNTLQVDIPSSEISSSINHELLWRSGAQRITCDLSTPLRWNALRQWRFGIVSQDLELFLLRDHVFLLIDLVDDWTSGPPAEYLVFTPFKYHLDLQLRNVKLYLNVNDANIINNPTDMEDNTYIVIASPELQSTTCIPVDQYRPSKNAIPFDVRAETASVDLHIPSWNTQSAFLESSQVGQLENLLVSGAYHYNAATSPANTDTLVLTVTGQSPTARLHGFTIRYFLKLKDNYFGDDIHFKTLEEYQESLRLKESNPEAALANRPPHKKSNDLDVILNIRADDPKVLIPANLYASDRYVQIDTASLSADLRFTNYYMDLDLVLAPLNLSLGNSEGGMNTPISATSSTQLFVDGLTVYGHRVFGLPPTEPTYLCNWDLSVGAVTGECTPDFLTTLTGAGRAFGFSFDDEENALVSYSSIIMYDVTFLRVFVQSVSIWLHIEEAAFQISAGSVNVNYNDWARSHYSKRANITIPDVRLSCVNSESAARNKTRAHVAVETDALVQTSVHLAVIGRKYNFTSERRLQQELVRRQDQRTHRTTFLYLPGLVEDFVPDQVDPPAQCFPVVPQPITSKDVEDDGSSLNSMGTSRHSKGLRRQSSFLSIASSSQDSIVKARTPSRSSVRTRATEYLQPTQQRTTRADVTTARTRDVSVSTGRHSAFYSLGGDNYERHDIVHNTVAFSSQYFAPYFPLENIQPDTREAPFPSIEQEEAGDEESVSFNLEDIDPEILDDQFAYSSVMLELPAGLTASFNPTSLRYVAALMGALQPTDPEDVLDSLQTSSMDEIFTMQKQQKMKGLVNDFLVRIPQANVRFVNSSDLDSPDPMQEEQDQYDFSLTKLALASRSETKWQDAFRPESKLTRSSFHLRLQSADASAAERFSSMDDPQAAAWWKIEDVMASMGTKDLTYLDVDVGSITGHTSSQKIEYLASLIHRTGTLASEFATVFAEITERETFYVRYLAYRLITEGKAAPDPGFLVRPSAVLRSARRHLRTFDSWKLTMRLRQMWSTLSRSEKDQLKLDCLGRSKDVPDNVRERAVASFQRWRSWDLENVSDSVIMNKIFGPAAGRHPTAMEDMPLLAVVRLKETRLVLDPGPKQNEIRILDLTTRVETQHTGEPQPAPAANATPGEAMIVANVYCGDASVNLNWELCELADDIMRLYNRMQRKESDSPPSHKPSTPASTAKGRPRAVHCVIALNRGSVALETVNLHASSLGEKMAISLLRTESTGVAHTNMILNCESIVSRLRNRSQPLGKVILQRPSIFVAHELRPTATTDCHTLKVTASSRDLSMVVRQDPVVLAEVADAIIRDELGQLYRLVQGMPSSPTPSTPSKTIADRLSAFRVNIAIFTDHYNISVPLLPSLIYNVSGTVTRAAMAANFGKEIIFDFDIKENFHEMQINVKKTPRTISLLQIPPTNGRVTSRTEAGEQSIVVSASVEVVQLDASAVYSLLTALNRPEITNSISDFQQQSQIIKDRLADVFGNSEPSAEKTEDKVSNQAAYSVYLTLAGLQIFGDSPTRSDSCPVAHISFELDSVHLQLTNRRDNRGPILEYPEAHVNLRRIAFGIQKGSEDAMQSCGDVSVSALITATSRPTASGGEVRFLDFKSDGLTVNLSPDTVSAVVDVLGFMGDKIKDLDTSRELEYLRKIRQSKPRIQINGEEAEEESDIIDTFLSTITYTFEISNIRLAWLINGPHDDEESDKEDLVLTLQRIDLSTRTKNSARLTIENLQAQMISAWQDKRMRSPNSALLPEIIFNVAYVSTADTRRLAFQAVGKGLDLRLTSGFIIPAAALKDSIGLSVKNVQKASLKWNMNKPALSSSTASEKPEETRRGSILGSKRMESFLVDADFAGAVVYLTGRKHPNDMGPAFRGARAGMAGKYGQFNQDEGSTMLRSPGLAFKMEYNDSGREDPTLYAEVKIDASSNILYPSVVPLVMDLTNSVKEVVSNKNDEDSPVESASPPTVKSKSDEGENILASDPTAVLGRVKLNLGMRIYRQEFSLSCQPIARVAATASFEDVYFTANTVRSADQGNFFAISGAFKNLQASVQHVYSRESTGSLNVDSITLSLMNSKHVSGTSGFSAILKVSPMKVSVNAKQLQDFLLFREIWIPRDLRRTNSAPVTKLATETSQTSQGHLVQRYQQVAATAAFPWTATIFISALEINVDFGQALGKSVFSIEDFWVSSKKTSDWEQNLCLGFSKIGADSTGRMSGFVALQNFKLRTLIKWPEREAALNETPLVQASIGFSHLRVKAAFDYQAFLVADITSMEFLMYNVRRSRDGSGDRLVAIFDGDALQIYGTTTSAAQGVALFQAFQRLAAERRANFETSLKEIERFMKRKSVAPPPSALIHPRSLRLAAKSPDDADMLQKSPISLDTDVVVTLKAVNLGVFPSTFSDHQVFKMEALNAQARFAASVESRRIHSILGLTLGQLRIGLAGVRQQTSSSGGGPPKALSELSVEDVVQSATGSRGGTILKVPRVEAVMQTWQSPNSRRIEYIFKSAFEGKVEVGWNYSRISYIRGMWANHSKTLAAAVGRELPAVGAIRVTGVPDESSRPPPSPQQQSDEKGEEGKEGGGGGGGGKEDQQRKITAEVKVPQSKYEYTALEPPVIETPQLRDMGEATPPLEWIGLNRDRLPNLTHQIVIVSLLELAGEVEDAYSRILGSS
ncbi:Protein CSF1 [Coniochaeta hoffmannii]|uniref:Protein CSF1 n=1 Tax=Coniochaeta hoffmannii TaxID=91930 RepID=A0AA38VI21_9PEZI|nr:Protein CSF1 [Coniochaeta hoffmannii]